MRCDYTCAIAEILTMCTVRIMIAYIIKECKIFRLGSTFS